VVTIPRLGLPRTANDLIDTQESPNQRAEMSGMHVVEVVTYTARIGEVPLVPGELHPLGVLRRRGDLLAEGEIGVIADGQAGQRKELPGSVAEDHRLFRPVASVVLGNLQ